MPDDEIPTYYDKSAFAGETRYGYRVLKWPAHRPPLADQIIVTDGGPWASHNVVCAVCGERGAILDLNNGVFMPCDICKHNGWSLTQRNPNWIMRLFKRSR